MRLEEGLFICCLAISQVCAFNDSPEQMPDFFMQPACAQHAFNQVDLEVGCSYWACACRHLNESLPVLSSRVVSICTGTVDMAAATSIFDGFCEQLLAGITSTASTTPTIVITSPGTGNISTGKLPTTLR